MSVWTAAAPPRVVGHRGGRGPGWPPENTIEAFERARLQGAPAIELDARASADGQAVVFHDPELTRMTAGRDRRRVHDLDAAALRAVDLGGARIPALADVLAWARARGVAVNVEIKYDIPSRRSLVRAVARAVRGSGADVLFSSFDPVLLALAAALLPAVPRALITHSRQSRWAAAAQAALWPPLAVAVHLERTQAGSLEAWRRRGMRVGVWTVNAPDEAADLARRGAAWIITDSPEDVIEPFGREDAERERRGGVPPAGA